MNRELLRLSIEKFVRFVFSRSGGKGGQNVNKLNTKVHAFISISSIEGLTKEELDLLKTRLSSSINQDNEIFVCSQEERTQELNRSIAISRLYGNILSAAYIQKTRKKTKPTKASKEKRLKNKKIRSSILQSRKISD